MTIDEEVRTLAKVCRMLAESVNAIARGSDDTKIYAAISLLDAIDARDGEPERKACTHSRTQTFGATAKWYAIACEKCGAIGRAPTNRVANNEWWPEGGAK